MVVDSSAIAAIFLKEAEASDLLDSIARATTRMISAATLAELGIVLDKRVAAPENTPPDELIDLVRSLGIQIVPFTEAHAQLARAAYRRFGKGRHAAGLNFGDCLSYALARSLDEPLLFKGNDFSLTDIRVA